MAAGKATWVPVPPRTEQYCPPMPCMLVSQPVEKLPLPLQSL